LDIPFTYIAVDGPIGVGKSTLVRRLAPMLRARAVYEEPRDNPFLPRFYADPKRWAFQTQLAFTVSRYRQLLGLAQGDLFTERTISDFSFYKDRIFAALTLTEDELSLYNMVQPVLAQRVVEPDCVVLLHAEVDVLMERIGGRGVPYEAQITRDYLERLAEGYRQFFFAFDEKPLLIVRTDEVDYTAPDAPLGELVERLARKGSGTEYFIPSDR